MIQQGAVARTTAPFLPATIQLLEHRLGFELLERDHTGMQLPQLQTKRKALN
jgi:DNA-binding transcriptional LysR family regulator